MTRPRLIACISGVILYDETLRQLKKDGVPLLGLISETRTITGIKVDTGAKDSAAHVGGTISEGLAGLRDRLQEYLRMGARFAKWRAVMAISNDTPGWSCIEANTAALARYAALCQEAGLVPIVEPELLMAGDHSLERCGEITEKVLRMVFQKLYEQGVVLEGMILKPNMVLPGSACSTQESVDQIADATIRCLLRAVPAAVPAIAFLSGGQSAQLASARLNALNLRSEHNRPWALSFSFGRALQQPALEIWQGHDKNTAAAQQALAYRAKCNGAACRGEYTSDMESK